uniref:Uncharacterized protein n=1 Tax=Candidozyma auris TaxID=498019 RepID=A0A0L0NYA3_CANAR
MSLFSKCFTKGPNGRAESTFDKPKSELKNNLASGSVSKSLINTNTLFNTSSLEFISNLFNKFKIVLAYRSTELSTVSRLETAFWVSKILMRSAWSLLMIPARANPSQGMIFSLTSFRESESEELSITNGV